MVDVERKGCFVNGREEGVVGEIVIWIYEKEVGGIRWIEEKM